MRSLLETGPSYSDKISATLDGQTGHFSYGIAIDVTTQDSNPVIRLPWQLQLAKHLSAQASLQLPKSWLDTIAQALDDPQITAEVLAGSLDSYVQQGWLVDQGDAYAAEGSYGNNELRLNGKPIFGGR